MKPEDDILRVIREAATRHLWGAADELGHPGAVGAAAAFEVVTPRGTTSFPPLRVLGPGAGEALLVRSYRVGPRRIEASFERADEALARGRSGPLTFSAALGHTLKLIDALLCHELGLPYDPHAPEQLQIWPTRVDADAERPVRKRRDLLQALRIDALEARGGGHFVRFSTEIEACLRLDAEARVLPA